MGNRKRMMWPCKKEAVSPNNLRDPLGNAHRLSLYSNKSYRTPLSPLRHKSLTLWINFPDTRRDLMTELGIWVSVVRGDGEVSTVVTL